MFIIFNILCVLSGNTIMYASVSVRKHIREDIPVQTARKILNTLFVIGCLIVLFAITNQVLDITGQLQQSINGR